MTQSTVSKLWRK